MAQTNPKGSSLPLTVAVVAIVIAIASIGLAYEGAIAPVSNLQSQVSTLQQQIGSQQVVNQAPTTRTVIMEWEATLPSTQDRFFPQVIVVNQGDSVHLYWEVNDTDGAHTFTIEAPTGTNGAGQLTQLNSSMPGQWIYTPPAQAGPMYGKMVTGAPNGCVTMGKPVPCNTVGGCSLNGGPLGVCTGSWMLKPGQTETASIHASVTFGPLLAPGIYEYVCSYHTAIGMVGYLIVLPNKG